MKWLCALVLLGSFGACATPYPCVETGGEFAADGRCVFVEDDAGRDATTSSSSSSSSGGSSSGDPELDAGADGDASVVVDAGPDARDASDASD